MSGARRTDPGEIVSRDGAGYDLLPLIHGSEGLLAVTTEITVNLRRSRSWRRPMAFDDIGKAGDAVAAVIASGIVPGGLEMMDQAATRAVEEFVHAGYPREAKAVLLVETDGTPEEVAADMAEIERVLAEAGATEIRVSKNEAQRQLFSRDGVPGGRPHLTRLLLHGRRSAARSGGVLRIGR
jgi:glycolate oxidase